MIVKHHSRSLNRVPFTNFTVDVLHVRFEFSILNPLKFQESPNPEDKNRKFIISYSLAKDEMQIYEPHQRYPFLLFDPLKLRIQFMYS